MADWATISSLATAGGTLVLAIATFSSVRSGNRSARVAELSLLAGVRPMLITSRDQDPPQRVGFGDGVVVTVPGHGAAADVNDGRIYMAIALRNGGQGIAVLHGWRVAIRERVLDDPNPQSVHQKPALDSFRRQMRDLYIPPGELGFWQGAIRDGADPDHGAIAQAITEGQSILVDLLYGDHEGGQRTIARFGVSPWSDVEGERAELVRYFNVDRDDPR